MPKDTVTDYPGTKSRQFLLLVTRYLVYLWLTYCFVICWFRPLQENPRQSWIMDSTPQIPDPTYWIPVFVSGTWILNSSRYYDSGFLGLYSGFQDQDSGFHKQKFPGLCNSDSLTILIWKPLHYNVSFVCLFVCLFSPRCLLSSRFLNFYKSNLAPCKVYDFRDPGIFFSFGFRNPKNSCLLDPKFWALESAV